MVVVIAILAAVTIVAYTGIRERAQASEVQTTVSQANKKILSYAVENAGQYPATLGDIGLTNSSSLVYDYSVNNASSPRNYCVTAYKADIQYSITSNNSSLSPGVCSGNNLIPWFKPDATTSPLPGGEVDTSQSAEGGASVRLGVNLVNQHLRSSPFSAQEGQVITISFLMRTDSNWNGGSANSKVRFFRPSDGSWRGECGYAGIKPTWTPVTCSYTFNSTNTSIGASLGNSGTVGNIWFDSVRVTIQ